MGFLAEEITAAHPTADAEQLAHIIQIAESSPVKIQTRNYDLWVTVAQYEKLRDLYDRSGETLTVSWSQFLSKVQIEIGFGWPSEDKKVDIVVPNWCNMLIGITPDGRSHS